MAKDEELLPREELLDLRHLLVRDGGDGIAGLLFGVALEQDAGGGFKSRKKHLVVLSNQVVLITWFKTTNQYEILYDFFLAQTVFEFDETSSSHAHQAFLAFPNC